MTVPTTPLSATRSACRDRLLEQWAAELLEYDRRLRGLAVTVRFDRAVAQLSGRVDHGDDLRRLRDLPGRLDGVLGVWDRVRVAGRPPSCGDGDLAR